VGDTDNSTVVTGGGGIYVYGPQLEEGTTASSFVANTTGSPKFITGATYGPRVPMILVEPSSENLILYSEDFSNAAWTKSGSSVVNGISSPDGNNTAFKLTEGTNNGNHYIEDSISNPSQSKQLLSIFIKNAGDNKVVRIATNDAATGFDYFFNPTTGQVVSDTFTSSKITTLNDGWYRIELLADGSNYVTNGSVPFIIQLSDSSTLSYQGDGTSGVYIWGAQLEESSVATSYIPTSGGNAAARTRAADDLVISGSDFTDLFNSGGDGTFYAEFIARNPNGGFYVLSGHSGNQRYFYSNSGSINLSGYDGLGGSLYPGGVQAELNRASISYDSNTKTGSLNGSADSTVTGTGDLQDSTRLSIGQAWSSSSQLNGHIKRLIYWPLHSDSL
jgi:hypothetical protein